MILVNSEEWYIKTVRATWASSGHQESWDLFFKAIKYEHNGECQLIYNGHVLAIGSNNHYKTTEDYEKYVRYEI